MLITNTITLFRRPPLAFFEKNFFRQTGWNKGSPARLCAFPFASFMFNACSFSSLFGLVVSLNVFLMFLRVEKQCRIKSSRWFWPVHTLIKLLSGAWNNKTDLPKLRSPIKTRALEFFWWFNGLLYPFWTENWHFNHVSLFSPREKTVSCKLMVRLVGILQICETGPCESCLVADDCLFL